MLERVVRSALLQDLPGIAGELARLDRSLSLRMAQEARPPEEKPDHYLTAEQVSQRYQIPVDAVYRRFRKFRLPLGPGTSRYSRAALERDEKRRLGR